MRNTQSIVLVFSLVAAILGIYYAEKPPFTHIAAVAVVGATVVGIVQASGDAKDAAFVQQTLSNLARSVPPSAWWRKEVDRLIREAGASQGYVINGIRNDTRDNSNPKARSIFLFKSRTSPPGGKPSGLLVVLPSDYAALSLFGKRTLKKEVQRLMYGNWDTNSAEEAGERVEETAVGLYGVPRPDQGFPIRRLQHSESTPLIIEVGTAFLSFEPVEVKELLAQPPIQRDLAIAEALEMTDPSLGQYIRVSDNR